MLNCATCKSVNIKIKYSEVHFKNQLHVYYICLDCLNDFNVSLLLTKERIDNMVFFDSKIKRGDML